MQPLDDQLFDLLEIWENKRQAGAVVSPEELAQGDPQLADRLRRAVERLGKAGWIAATAAAIESAQTISPQNAEAENCWPPGGVLGPYEFLELLGKGGMRAVFKARHTRLGKYVAVKVLPETMTRNHEALARFDREIKAVGALEHPNIIRAMDADEDRGVHYLVMEYVDGEDLYRLVKRQGPLPIAQACRLIRDAASALDHIHRLGLIHRDVKPSNLLLTTSGQLKVLDLGLARLAMATGEDEGLTSTGVSLGTPDYMAPEQWSDASHVDARTDLYALGCTLHFLLLGRAPFTGEQYRSVIAKMTGHAQGLVSSLRETRADLPEEVDAICRKLLAKKPEDRIQTAEELARQLAPFADPIRVATGASSDAQRPAAAVSPSRPPKSIASRIGIASAIAAAAISLFFVLWRPWEKNEREVRQDKGRIVSVGSQGSKQDAAAETPIEATSAGLKTEDDWLNVMPLFDLPRDGSFYEDFTRWRQIDEGVANEPRDDWGKLSLPVEIESGDYLVEIEVTPSTESGRLVFDLAHPKGVVSFGLFPDPQFASLDIKRAVNRRQKIRIHVKREGDKFEIRGGESGEIETVLQLDQIHGLYGSACLPPARNGVKIGDRDVFEIHAIRMRPNDGKLAIDVPQTRREDLPSNVVLKALPGILPSPQPLIDGRRWQVIPRQAPIFSVAVENDDRTLIAAAGEEGGVIRIFEWKSLEEAKVLIGHAGPVARLAWSPDGRFLASAGRDSTVRIWECATGMSVALRHGQGTSPQCLAWSRDGERLATGGDYGDHVARMWRKNGELLWAVQFSHQINDVAWNDDSTTVYCAVYHDRSYGLSAETGASLNIALPGKSGALAHHPKKPLLVLAGHWESAQRHKLFFWDSAANRLVHEVETMELNGQVLRYTPDGTNLVNERYRGGGATVWDGESGLYLGLANADQGWQPATAESKPVRLAVPGVSSLIVIDATDANAPVRQLKCAPRPSFEEHSGFRLANNQKDSLRRASSGIPLTIAREGHAPLKPGEHLSHLAFGWTPKSDSVLAWTTLGEGMLIDPSTGKPTTRFAGGMQGIQHTTWSRDGGLLAAATWGPAVWVWNRSGELKHRFEVDAPAVFSLAISPDERWLAVGLQGKNTAQLWNLTTGERGPTLVNENEWQIQQLFWASPESLLVWSTQSFTNRNVSNTWLWTIEDREAVSRSIADGGQIVPRLASPENPWFLLRPDGANWRLRSLDGVSELVLQDSPLEAHEWKMRIDYASFDNGEVVSLLSTDQIVRTWDSNTGELLRLMLLMPEDRSITFDRAGKVLSRTPKAHEHLAYAVETANAPWQIVTPEEFVKLQLQNESH